LRSKNASHPKEMVMTGRIALLTAALTLAAPAVAAADAYELGFVSATRWVTSDSADALGEDDAHHQLGVGAGIRLDGIRPFGLALYFDAEYSHQGMTGTTFQRIDSDMSMHSVRAGARLEHRFNDWAATYGRFSMGYVTANLRLSEELSNLARPMSDRAHGASSAIGGGLDLSLFRGKRFNVLVRTELEYERVSGLEFEASPQRPGDDILTIPVTAASLGTVDMSGFGFRLGIVGRY
jgi:hypothetical protein